MKTNNNIYMKYIIACIIPILILFGLSAKPMLTVWFGEDVILETKPVDPRDLFRGDYVILSYKIEEIPINLIDNEVIDKYEKDYGGFDVYLLLDSDNIPVKLSLDKPKSGLFIKGELDYIDMYSDIKSEHHANISYGLDNYYVPENTGLELEDASRNGELEALIKVRNGHAVLIDINIK